MAETSARLAFRLDRARDDGAGSERVALHGQHVLGCHQQLHGLRLRCGAFRFGGILGAFAARAERGGNGEQDDGFAQHVVVLPVLYSLFFWTSMTRL